MQGVPLTPREVRILDYLHSVQDVFPRVTEWPEWAIRSIVKPHRNNRERYNLFFFLTGNGLNPEIAADWTLLIDCRPDRFGYPRPVKSLGYDASAQQQMEQMKQQIAQGTFFQGRKRMLDLVLGYVVDM